jgi:hypothetical protein
VQIAGVSTGLAKIPDSDCQPSFAMEMVANITAPGQTVTIGNSAFGNIDAMYVDWGDGSAEQLFSGGIINAVHNYAAAGDYTVRVRYSNSAQVAAFSCNNSHISSIVFGPQTQGMTFSLSLNDNELTNAALGVVPQGVSGLELINNQLTGPGFCALVPDVATLRLSGNNMEGIDFTEALHGFPNLSTLHLVDAQLNNFSLTGVSSQLIEFDISGNNLDENPIADLLNLDNTQLLTMMDNVLPPAEVDAVLVQLDTAGFSNYFVDLTGQTPAAPPTATGLAAKASLEGKGWTVNVDV